MSLLLLTLDLFRLIWFSLGLLGVISHGLMFLVFPWDICCLSRDWPSCPDNKTLSSEIRISSRSKIVFPPTIFELFVFPARTAPQQCAQRVAAVEQLQATTTQFGSEIVPSKIKEDDVVVPRFPAPLLSGTLLFFTITKDAPDSMDDKLPELFWLEEASAPVLAGKHSFLPH